jgi:hypothetical protein
MLTDSPDPALVNRPDHQAKVPFVFGEGGRLAAAQLGTLRALTEAGIAPGFRGRHVSRRSPSTPWPSQRSPPWRAWTSSRVFGCRYDAVTSPGRPSVISYGIE